MFRALLKIVFMMMMMAGLFGLMMNRKVVSNRPSGGCVGQSWSNPLVKTGQGNPWAGGGTLSPSTFVLFSFYSGFLKGFSTLLCCCPPTVFVFHNISPVLLRDDNCAGQVALQLVLEAHPWGSSVTFALIMI